MPVAAYVKIRNRWSLLALFSQVLCSVADEQTGTEPESVFVGCACIDH